MLLVLWFSLPWGEWQNAEVEAGVVDPVVKIISEDPADVAPAVQLLRELSKVTSARPEITEKMGIVETIKLLNKHQGDTDPVGSEVSKVLEMYWREDPYVAIQMASVGMFQPLIHLLGPGERPPPTARVVPGG